MDSLAMQVIDCHTVYVISAKVGFYDLVKSSNHTMTSPQLIVQVLVSRIK